MIKKTDYVNLLANLGTTLQVPEEVEKGLEKFRHLWKRKDASGKRREEKNVFAEIWK